MNSSKDFIFHIEGVVSVSELFVIHAIYNNEFQDGIEIGTPVTRITTPSADSVCGVYLEVGQVYILNGELNLRVFESIKRTGWSTNYLKFCRNLLFTIISKKRNNLNIFIHL